jgi:hypothetical protein
VKRKLFFALLFGYGIYAGFQNVQAAYENRLGETQYQAPRTGKLLTKRHPCTSCTGKCLLKSGVGNCCSNQVCIGVCDGGWCSSSTITTTDAVVVMYCSAKCRE